MRSSIPILRGKGKTSLRWTMITGLLVLPCVLFGCRHDEAEETKPGQILTSDGKPAPPEAYSAMKAGNGGAQTGAKGRAAQGGPPD